jgi:hypothetical protein
MRQEHHRPDLKPPDPKLPELQDLDRPLPEWDMMYQARQDSQEQDRKDQGE